MSKKSKPLPEASYIPLARKLVQVKTSKKAVLEAEKSIKRLLARAMHAVGVSNFRFSADGKDYRATLYRPTVQTVCLQKLYTAVRSEEITLDEFLRCVTPDNDAILSLYGQDFLDRMSTYERGPLDLIISKG